MILFKNLFDLIYRLINAQTVRNFQVKIKNPVEFASKKLKQKRIGSFLHVFAVVLLDQFMRNVCKSGWKVKYTAKKHQFTHIILWKICNASYASSNTQVIEDLCIYFWWKWDTNFSFINISKKLNYAYQFVLDIAYSSVGGGSALITLFYFLLTHFFNMQKRKIHSSEIALKTYW